MGLTLTTVMSRPKTYKIQWNNAN